MLCPLEMRGFFQIFFSSIPEITLPLQSQKYPAIPLRRDIQRCGRIHWEYFLIIFLNILWQQKIFKAMS
jgi:hypothetical protein